MPKQNAKMSRIMASPPKPNRLLNTPTWEILATEDKLRQQLEIVGVLYDDPELERVLQATAHVLHMMIRDYVRLGHITEEEYEHQKQLAKLYNVRDHVDVEAAAVFDSTE